MAKTRTTDLSPRSKTPAKSTASSTSDLPMSSKPLSSIERFRNIGIPDYNRLEKYQNLMGLMFERARVFDWEALNQLGLEEEVREALRKGGLEKYASIDEPTYKEITIEFLTSVDVDFEKDEVSFQLWGEKQKLTMAEFNKHLGCIDSEEELEGAVGEVRKDFKDSEFWKKISGLPKRGKCSANLIVPHRLRIIHQFLAGSLTCRGNKSMANTNDLFLLWCLEKGVKINAGEWFLKMAMEVSSNKKGCILCGMYVTKLAKSLYPAFTDEGLTVETESHPLNFASLKQLGVCSMDGESYIRNVELWPQDKGQMHYKASALKRTYPTRQQTRKLEPGALLVEDLTLTPEEKMELLKKVTSMPIQDFYLLCLQTTEQLAAAKKRIAKLESKVAEMSLRMGFSESDVEEVSESMVRLSKKRKLEEGDGEEETAPEETPAKKAESDGDAQSPPAPEA